MYGGVKMVGQVQLLKQIDDLIENKELPRFIVITGKKGSGKKLVAHYISTKSHAAEWVLPNNKIDTIRLLIHEAYKHINPIICILQDADEMSNEAQNSLLKLAEEPPNNAVIVMTVQDINNVLRTIKSRAFVLSTEPYTLDQLNEYVVSQYEGSELYGELCDTPGECDLLHKMGGPKFVEFVDKVVDNIGTVPIANCFKVVDSLAVDKEDDKGYDVRLFFKAVIRRCLKKDPMDKEYIQMAMLTSERLSQLRMKNLNKRMLVTTWILDVRKLWT